MTRAHRYRFALHSPLLIVTNCAAILMVLPYVFLIVILLVFRPTTMQCSTKQTKLLLPTATLLSPIFHRTLAEGRPSTTSSATRQTFIITLELVQVLYPAPHLMSEKNLFPASALMPKADLLVALFNSKAPLSCFRFPVTWLIQHHVRFSLLLLEVLGPLPSPQFFVLMLATIIFK